MDDTVLGLVPKEVTQLFAGYTQDVRSELTLLKLYDPAKYKKRLREQLFWQDKVRQLLSVRGRDTVDLGDIDPSAKTFYNVDWQLVYERRVDFTDNRMNALGIPTDEPDYIKVFELLGVTYELNRHLLFRRAIENGFDKVVKYISRPLGVFEQLNESWRDLTKVFNSERARYQSTMSLIVTNLNRHGYSTAKKYISDIDQNSIAFSIILAVQRKFYSTIRLLSLQDECYSTLLYVFDRDFITEYYRRYYNLDVKNYDLDVLVATMAYISTAEWYLNKYETGVFPRDTVRDYLIIDLEYSVILGTKRPATRYSTDEYLSRKDRYPLYAYLVLNGAPITEKDYLSKAIDTWGYDALKVVDSSRFTDIMTYEKSSVPIISAVYRRFMREKNQKELLYMIDYMLLADTRERKNESLAYNKLYVLLKITNEDVAKYLKDRLEEYAIATISL